MGLLTLIVSFQLALSFLLATCASDQLNLQKPLQQVDHHPKFSQPSLPRKLINLNHETVKSSAEEDFTLRDKFRQVSPGTKQHGKEENAMNVAEKETWRSEDEGPHKSEYFTMDYGWVKNKNSPDTVRKPFSFADQILERKDPDAETVAFSGTTVVAPEKPSAALPPSPPHSPPSSPPAIISRGTHHDPPLRPPNPPSEAKVHYTVRMDRPPGPRPRSCQPSCK